MFLVKYNEGTQVLNGFEIRPTKKSKPGILTSRLKGIDQHAKETAKV
jgi:hypothetical protein